MTPSRFRMSAISPVPVLRGNDHHLVGRQRTAGGHLALHHAEAEDQQHGDGDEQRQETARDGQHPSPFPAVPGRRRRRGHGLDRLARRTGGQTRLLVVLLRFRRVEEGVLFSAEHYYAFLVPAWRRRLLNTLTGIMAKSRSVAPSRLKLHAGKQATRWCRRIRRSSTGRRSPPCASRGAARGRSASRRTGCRD